MELGGNLLGGGEPDIVLWGEDGSAIVRDLGADCYETYTLGTPDNPRTVPRAGNVVGGGLFVGTTDGVERLSE